MPVERGAGVCWPTHLREPQHIIELQAISACSVCIYVSSFPHCYDPHNIYYDGCSSITIVAVSAGIIMLFFSCSEAILLETTCIESSPTVVLLYV